MTYVSRQHVQPVTQLPPCSLHQQVTFDSSTAVAVNIQKRRLRVRKTETRAAWAEMQITEEDGRLWCNSCRGEKTRADSGETLLRSDNAAAPEAARSLEPVPRDLVLVPKGSSAVSQQL